MDGRMGRWVNGWKDVEKWNREKSNKIRMREMQTHVSFVCNWEDSKFQSQALVFQLEGAGECVLV